jgi:glycosyltransferase involved in cell wall biosynthesis
LSRPPLEPLVVDLVIAAHNCAGSLGATLAALPARELRSVVVVDSASTDATPLVARDAGAVLLHEPSEGYGAACRRAIVHLEALPRPPDVVVFLSADGSDDPRVIGQLLEPMRGPGGAELVLVDRQPADGEYRPGAGDRLALGLIGLLYRHQFADLGRLRAIRFPALVALGLSDRGEGWNVEMQVKALRFGLRIAEVAVEAMNRPARPGGMRASLSSTGRKVFQILRHATAR